MIKIAAISDLHGTLPEINKCDLCLIAGDVIPLSIQRNRIESVIWFFKTFLPWIKELPCQEVFMIAGNHDFEMEKNYPVMKALEYLSDFKLTYLQNDYAIFRADDGQDIKVYGSPQCHKFGNWAFMYYESYLESLYSQVPSDIDIWLTHDTPKIGDLDLLPPSQWNKEPIHAGGESLAKAIQTKQPKLVVCGHLHTCAVKYERNDDTQLVNVSILNNAYQHVYEPTYINYTNSKINILDSHKED